MVKLPPNRADLAKAEKLARRLLNNHKKQIIRAMAKAYLSLVRDLDAYVESVYPCFDIVDEHLRSGCNVVVGIDGVFRLICDEEAVVMTGNSFRDLCINLVLWRGEWPSHEDFEDLCRIEDEEAGLEPNMDV